ncbi:hypothetical protein PDESU_04419 [Pontiella desulfatans]|uniref:DUF4136 domain-containing protein n=1 Tax=Pontiella desulfatans TaxID=2750659 RepID=A0A6C2U6Y2_PONDE|nr:hypothetical protein [Pontiella desulfatans]VGO15832.1 hypothetical protein PDESU_04419 [Pontiella desulfatans]
MKQWMIKLSAIFALALVSGCATSFQANRLEPVSGYPSVRNKKTVYINLAFSGKVNGEPWTKLDQENQAYLRDRCIDHLEDSGMFSLVSDDLKTTDLQLYVAIIDDKTTSTAKQTLSALTLFLIPYTETDQFRMMAVVKDTFTGKETKISLKDGVNHRQALLLAPLAPFKPSKDALEECTDRMLQNLCLEIHRSGFVK